MVTKFKNLQLLQHPVLMNKLFRLRSKDCGAGEFRVIVSEMSRLIAYEATRDLSLSSKPVETPMEKTEVPCIEDKLSIVSILRAGNGMLEGVAPILPFASIGHIGIYRDKFIKTTVEYFMRLPADIEGRKILLLDPLLATGDTALASIARLKDYNVGKIKFLCLLAAPEGIAKIQEKHPDVEIFALSLERELNKEGYILPGIGDVGDRLYGTV